MHSSQYGEVPDFAIENWDIFPSDIIIGGSRWEGVQGRIVKQIFGTVQVISLLCSGKTAMYIVYSIRQWARFRKIVKGRCK